MRFYVFVFKITDHHNQHLAPFCCSYLYTTNGLSVKGNIYNCLPKSFVSHSSTFITYVSKSRRSSAIVNPQRNSVNPFASWPAISAQLSFDSRICNGIFNWMILRQSVDNATLECMQARLCVASTASIQPATGDHRPLAIRASTKHSHHEVNVGATAVVQIHSEILAIRRSLSILYHSIACGTMHTSLRPRCTRNEN